MNYLVVSCTTYDMAGRAMIQGAINGISSLDNTAKFSSLEQPEHHGDWINWFRQPQENEAAFKWADIILDIGGMFTNQSYLYNWLKLRKKFNKRVIFMSQSFMNIDPTLLKDAVVIARGKRSGLRLEKLGIKHKVASDLSFLILPEKMEIKPNRVFSTHIIKEITKMFEVCDDKSDLQIIEKLPQGKMVWEPTLPIPSFHGTPEQHFGIIEHAREIHTARYQIACGAILAGKKPIIYATKDNFYNEKYEDLMDYFGMSQDELRKLSMISCEEAVSCLK